MCAKYFGRFPGSGFAGCFGGGRAESVPLADGTAVSGEIVSFNDNGINFPNGRGQIQPPASWNKFSQGALKQLAQNPKIEPLVEPFIEMPPRTTAPNCGSESPGSAALARCRQAIAVWRDIFVVRRATSHCC